MIFYPLMLFGKVQTATDPLGNPIYALEQTGESEGRFSSWTAEEIALDRRDVTVNNRKILTRASAASLAAADRVQIDGKYHDIKEIKGDEATRWRIVVVDRYGSEVL